MVTVEVGPEKTTFLLHKALLVKHAYFEKNFNGPFIESQEQKLILADDNPEAFNLVAEYLYTNNVTGGDEGDLIKELLVERAKADPELTELMARFDSPEKSLLEENKKFQTYYDDATAAIAQKAVIYFDTWISSSTTPVSISSS